MRIVINLTTLFCLFATTFNLSCAIALILNLVGVFDFNILTIGLIITMQLIVLQLQRLMILKVDEE